MTLIDIQQLTKDYGDGRGIFDLTFSIVEGEAFGFAGTNGSGKTTTIRHIMGFLKQQKGEVLINGLDAWEQSAQVKKLVGYIPGEIAFPDVSTGWAFIHQQADLLEVKDLSFANELIERLQLDPSANIKRMSKGMKQKTAIVVALMADRPILILDEPTTGLDPLMRAEFIEILKEQKAKGKTIFMSSHMFEEFEELCDRVAMLKDGHLIDVIEVSSIKNDQQQFLVEFSHQEAYKSFLNENLHMTKVNDLACIVTIQPDQINALLTSLAAYEFANITEQPFTLQNYFYQVYAEAISND